MGFLSSIFGKKPKVPDFVPVDYDKEYDASTDYNQANIGKWTRLALDAQAADQKSLNQGLRSAIPNYDELLSSEYDITKRMLSGEMADELSAKFTQGDKDRMRDRRAARGLSTGQQDSDYTDYQYARDLGITEYELSKENKNLQLQLLGQGMSQLDNRVRRQSAFMAQPVSVTSMFQSPQQRIQQKMSERDSKFKRDYAQAKVDAAPDPVAVGLTKVAAAAIGGGLGGVAAGGAASSLGKVAGTLLGGAAGGPLGSAVGGFLGGGGFGSLFGGGGGSTSTGLNFGGFYGAGQVQGPNGNYHSPMAGASGLAYSTSPNYNSYDKQGNSRWL